MENGHERRVYGSMLDLACDVRNPSPLVELPLGLKHAKVYGKLEWYNPFGSVKDRVALQLVDDALGSGKVASFPNTRLDEKSWLELNGLSHNTFRRVCLRQPAIA